jgi:hypothetical protein
LRTWGEFLGNQAVQEINYSWVKYTIFDELDGMTGLFGGSQDEHGHLKDSPIESTRRANLFIRQIVGSRPPSYLLQGSEMGDLQNALRAMADPRNQTEEENCNDFRELGILNGDKLNWSRIKEVGRILRAKRFYQTEAVKDRGAPFLSLKAELAKVDGHENKPGETLTAVL